MKPIIEHTEGSFQAYADLAKRNRKRTARPRHGSAEGSSYRPHHSSSEWREAFRAYGFNPHFFR